MTTERIAIPDELVDELLCIADFKLVLGGWYLVVVPNGRSVGDWCALCGIMQDHYGHARAIYRYLAAVGVPESAVDPTRSASAIRGPSILDRPPSSWTDFIVTAFVAERVVDAQLESLSTVQAAPDQRLVLLTRKTLRESRFHHTYLDGWLRSLRTSDEEATTSLLSQKLHDALDWWPPGDDTRDVVHQAGFRMRDTDVRSEFLAAVGSVVGTQLIPRLVAPPNAGSWDRSGRRGDGLVGIPPGLHEAIRFRNLDMATT